VKEKRLKTDQYSKYVREMYWPKVSVKKQLELEHIKTTLRNTSIRKSAKDLEDVDEEEDPKGTPGGKKMNGYEKPWRDAMSKNPHRGSESVKGSPSYNERFPASAKKDMKTQRFMSQDPSTGRNFERSVSQQGTFKYVVPNNNESFRNGNSYLQELHMS